MSFRGGMETEEGEIGSYFEDQTNVKPSPYSPFYKKPRNLYNTGQAVCGARGCTRACMISMENRGILKNKFESPFRTKKPWLVDWTDYQPVDESADPVTGSKPERQDPLQEVRKDPD